MEGTGRRFQPEMNEKKIAEFSRKVAKGVKFEAGGGGEV